MQLHTHARLCTSLETLHGIEVFLATIPESSPLQKAMALNISFIWDACAKAMCGSCT